MFSVQNKVRLSEVYVLDWMNISKNNHSLSFSRYMLQHHIGTRLPSWAVTFGDKHMTRAKIQKIEALSLREATVLKERTPYKTLANQYRIDYFGRKKKKHCISVSPTICNLVDRKGHSRSCILKY